MLQRLLFATLLLSLQPTLASAQDVRQGNLGTEFVLSFPANWEFDAREKFVRLYFVAEEETEVRVRASANRYNVTALPGEINSVDLPNGVAQVFVRNDQSPVPNDRVYPDAAVHVTSDSPIVLYAINRTTFTSDGLLVLPVSSLGTQYVVATARSVEGAGQSLPSQFMVTAAYDQTTVTMFASDDTPNHKEGEKIEVVMDKGDVFSAMSVGFGGDLSGSQIYADKPVAVTAGQNCTYIPDERYPACDHIVEMMTPVNTWGRVYHSNPFVNRTKSETYRVFAGEPDASIYINGTLMATLPNVGGANGSGWIEYRQEERTPLTFSSDKRIQVVQYNNSQTYDQSTATDPFMMILSPVEQHLGSFTISTPSDNYASNYLSIAADSATFDSWEIAPFGTTDWEPLAKHTGAFEQISFRAVPGSGPHTGITISIEPGAYQLRGNGKASCYIYGGGNFDSYGYPAALGLDSLRLSSDVPRFSLPEELDLTMGR